MPVLQDHRERDQLEESLPQKWIQNLNKIMLQKGLKIIVLMLIAPHPRYQEGAWFGHHFRVVMKRGRSMSLRLQVTTSNLTNRYFPGHTKDPNSANTKKANDRHDSLQRRNKHLRNSWSICVALERIISSPSNAFENPGLLLVREDD